MRDRRDSTSRKATKQGQSSSSSGAVINSRTSGFEPEKAFGRLVRSGAQGDKDSVIRAVVKEVRDRQASRGWYKKD